MGEKADIVSIRPSRVPGRYVLDVFVSFNETLADSNILASYVHVSPDEFDNLDDFLDAVKKEIKEVYKRNNDDENRVVGKDRWEDEKKKELQEKANKLAEMLSNN